MKWFLVFLSVGVIVFGIWLGGFSSITYEGKEVFYSESEYLVFKEVVGSLGVEINDMAVLSSSPPIVVDFSVQVDRGIGFAYGKNLFVWQIVGGGVLVIAGLIGCLFVLLGHPKPEVG